MAFLEKILKILDCVLKTTFFRMYHFLVQVSFKQVQRSLLKLLFCQICYSILRYLYKSFVQIYRLNMLSSASMTGIGNYDQRKH